MRFWTPRKRSLLLPPRYRRGSLGGPSSLKCCCERCPPCAEFRLKIVDAGVAELSAREGHIYTLTRDSPSVCCFSATESHDHVLPHCTGTITQGTLWQIGFTQEGGDTIMYVLLTAGLTGLGSPSYGVAFRKNLGAGFSGPVTLTAADIRPDPDNDGTILPTGPCNISLNYNPFCTSHDPWNAAASDIEIIIECKICECVDCLEDTLSCFHRVTIAGIVNGTCPVMDQMNGDYIVEQGVGSTLLPQELPGGSKRNCAGSVLFTVSDGGPDRNCTLTLRFTRPNSPGIQVTIEPTISAIAGCHNGFIRWELTLLGNPRDCATEETNIPFDSTGQPGGTVDLTAATCTVSDI